MRCIPKLERASLKNDEKEKVVGLSDLVGKMTKLGVKVFSLDERSVIEMFLAFQIAWKSRSKLREVFCFQPDFVFLNHFWGFLSWRISFVGVMRVFYVFAGGNGLKIEFLGKKIVCLIFKPSPILKKK